ncbi:DUF1307 domain-containing protein [Streptococcus plurextorum]|uniref:DUF1307 domain-containing protein n=1 Tax=Streptococcus plurextorum TaxID=456876 RepID=UPI00041AE393|nr:DUF1307 domain-containing protein [Streptococcus plurextorum]
MKKKRFSLALMMVALLSLILVACGGKKEISKRYFQLQTSGTDVRLVYYYEKDTNKVVKQTTDTKIVYADAGTDRETVKATVEPLAEAYKNVTGVEHSIDYGETVLTEHVTIDYSKANLKEIGPLIGVDTTSNNINYIGMKESAEMLLTRKFTEVKDGKFKALK